MRFLHRDTGSILEYLLAADVDIRELEWELHPPESGYAFLPWTIRRRDARPPRRVSAIEVEKLYRYSLIPENSGTTLRMYFHVDAPSTDRAVSLDAAVEHVEAFGGPSEFVLAGYHDGGLISVSRYLLPFQQGLSDVSEWWGP